MAGFENFSPVSLRSGSMEFLTLPCRKYTSDLNILILSLQRFCISRHCDVMGTSSELRGQGSDTSLKFKQI